MENKAYNNSSVTIYVPSHLTFLDSNPEIYCGSVKLQSQLIEP